MAQMKNTLLYFGINNETFPALSPRNVFFLLLSPVVLNKERGSLCRERKGRCLIPRELVLLRLFEAELNTISHQWNLFFGRCEPRCVTCVCCCVSLFLLFKSDHRAPLRSSSSWVAEHPFPLKSSLILPLSPSASIPSVGSNAAETKVMLGRTFQLENFSA